MARLFFLLAWLATCAVAWGDIELIKDTFAVGEAIVIKVVPTGVPEGAILRGSLQVAGANVIQPVATESTFYCWAKPGIYTVSATGIWAQTDTGELGGKLTDLGMYSYTRTFQVGPEVPVPPPFPPVPPVPVGERWSVIFEETKDRTPQQASLFVKLRKSSTIQILDVSNLPPAWKALESQRPPNLPLPVQMVLVRQPDKSNQVVRTVALPSSAEAVKAEVLKP